METRFVNHSHLPIQHLIRQVERQRSGHEKRDLRPRWLSDFINEIADLFDPYSGLARAGFDCRLVDEQWITDIYLGTRKMVGGGEDGRIRYTNFRFDLHALIQRFEIINRLDWHALPEAGETGHTTSNSFLAIDGHVYNNPLLLQIFSIPPTEAGPALWQYPDGRCDPI